MGILYIVVAFLFSPQSIAVFASPQKMHIGNLLPDLGTVEDVAQETFIKAYHSLGAFDLNRKLLLPFLGCLQWHCAIIGQGIFLFFTIYFGQ